MTQLIYAITVSTSTSTRSNRVPVGCFHSPTQYQCLAIDPISKRARPFRCVCDGIALGETDARTCAVRFGMQAVLDAAWSRRERWAAFQHIQDLVQRSNPQEGDLPTLLRRYVSENLLQPFDASQNSEPKLWALLSVAADHNEFIQFIRSFVARVPSSRATTELLFLLDKLVQANLHAVLALLELDADHGLVWTKTVSPSGAEALLRVRRYHEGVLSARGLWDASVSRVTMRKCAAAF